MRWESADLILIFRPKPKYWDFSWYHNASAGDWYVGIGPIVFSIHLWE